MTKKEPTGPLAGCETIYLVEGGAITQEQVNDGAYPATSLGKTEWELSDGPPGARSYSECFDSFEEALVAARSYPGAKLVVDLIEEPVRQPDPRLPYSLALLEVRAVLDTAMENYQSAPPGSSDWHVYDLLNQLHQENESKIDTDQTKYLIDRGWASLTEDGWWNVPEHIDAEALYYGHANAMELQEWFG